MSREADAAAREWQAMALEETLALAVPFRMLEVARWSPDRRDLARVRAAVVLGSQGDALQYGNRRVFGDGTEALGRHLVMAGRDEKCPDQLCWCNRKGQPDYSPGEVFSKLVTALACAAFLAGGVTFRGMHWCADHAGCPAGETGERVA